MRRAFTLIEVLVAMVVLATISAGLLATTWRLVGIARDYVDRTAADAYCHDVIFALAMNTNAFESGFEWNWKIQTNELPRIVSEDLFGQKKTTYALWRRGNPADPLSRLADLPSCRVEYRDPKSGTNNLVVSVSWHDMNDVLQTHSNVTTRVNRKY